MLVPLFIFVHYVEITILAFYESKQAHTFTYLNFAQGKKEKNTHD